MKKTNIKAAAISTTLTIILITFLTMYSELNTAFKDALKGLAGHHWVAKGIIAFVFFMVAYFVISRLVDEGKNVKKSVTYVVITTIICSLAILFFYAYEFFA